MTISRMDDVAPTRRHPHRHASARIVDGYIDRLSIRTPSGRTLVRNLSGGNQQKVIFAKWLNAGAGSCSSTSRRAASTSARSARSTQLLRDLAARGTAIVMVSSELPEVSASATGSW